MHDVTQQFGAHLRAIAPRLAAAFTDTALARYASYQPVERADLENSFLTLTEHFADFFSTGDTSVFQQYIQTMTATRARQQVEMSDMIEMSALIREAVLAELRSFIEASSPWPNEALIEIGAGQYLHLKTLVLQMVEYYNQIRSELASQAEELEAQRSTISEIGTPILPLYEGIIVLPLVGALDSRRATQVMERLLEAISEQQADIAIIDITGVPVVDTGVANYLMQAARAAQLIGAEVLLVGIGAEVAQVLVQLGVDLGNVTVCANLQAGITQALAKIGKRIS
jgi:rsbT co-antagonist protein RsbR